MQWSIYDFLSTEGFQPHGMCLLWRADVFWAHIASDILIAASYLSIPIALVYFALKRPDFAYRWVLFLFGAFIVACGVTHLFGIWTMWVPDYGAQAVMKAMTAAVSVTTAFSLWPMMPKLLAIPSVSDLAKKNDALASEIASRVAVEEELRHLNNELETRVKTRTAELEERASELGEAIRAAQKSNAAKTEFLANMSHEIRTPMNGVSGLLHLLEREPLTPDQLDIIDRANGAARDLLSIINDVLDYSKLEAGSVDLDMAEFSPGGCVTEVAQLLSDRAAAKGLELSCDIASDLPDRVIGDERRFRQVLLNLVGNAIKFTDQGSVAVKLRCADATTEPGHIQVSVHDTGIGIAPSACREIFQRFQQADADSGRRFAGTGLGLAIVRELVALMGGEVSVTSTLRQGSVFSFNARFDPVLKDAAQVARAIHVSEQTAVSGLHILVAEDNETNRFFIVRLLQNMGHSVETVETGAGAIEAARRSSYDLILMDIYMPEVDGHVAVQAIRKMEGHNRNVPIIALTANAMAGDRQYYMSKGMDEYVTKPVNPRILVAAINKVVSARAMVADA